MKRIESKLWLYGFLGLFLLLTFSSSAFGVFLYNPIDESAKLSNPLKDESKYNYIYWKTSSITLPTDPNWLNNPANYDDRFRDIEVLGYRTNRDGANPTWYKERGWTISTHGLFGSRGGRHNGLDIAAPVGTPVYT